MFNSDGQRKDFPIKGGSLTVGRKNTCGLRIPLSSVSREHFRIEQDGDQLVLRDLGSSNGTFYNGERVQEADLGAGDQIKVGPVTFIVTVDGEPAEIEPVRTVLPAERGREAGEVEAGEPEAASSEAVASAEPAESAPAEAPAPTPAAVAEQPEAIEPADEMPSDVEEESHSPTVDFDEDEEDDPIAALEALAAATDEDDDEPIPFIEDEEQDEDEEQPSSRRGRSQ